MKKIILSGCILVCGAVLWTGCTPSKEELKKQFVTECKSKLPGSIPPATGDEYCGCAAEKLLTKYSVSDLVVLNQKVSKGDTKANAEMMTVIQPCLDELTKKVAEQNQ